MYAVLNTHKLEMILQLKYMSIVICIQSESPRVTGKARNAMTYGAPYLQYKFGDPRLFLRF